MVYSILEYINWEDYLVNKISLHNSADRSERHRIGWGRAGYYERIRLHMYHYFERNPPDDSDEESEF